MNQATQRSEQKHRQPGKPELAAGTRETPQRCCNLGGKLGLLEQGPTAAHPSQDSQAWSAETRTLAEAQGLAVQAGKRRMGSASHYRLTTIAPGASSSGPVLP